MLIKKKKKKKVTNKKLGTNFHHFSSYVMMSWCHCKRI